MLLNLCATSSYYLRQILLLVFTKLKLPTHVHIDMISLCQLIMSIVLVWSVRNGSGLLSGLRVRVAQAAGLQRKSLGRAPYALGSGSYCTAIRESLLRFH